MKEAVARIWEILEHDVMHARRLAEAAVAEFPDAIEAREALMFTYIRTNDMPGVVAMCESLPPTMSSGLLLEAKGLALLQLGRNEESAATLRAAVQMRPMSLIADRIARALHRQGRLNEAIGILGMLSDQLGADDKIRFNILRQLIYVLRDARRWVEADAAVLKLLELHRQAPLPVASAVVGADMELPYPGWIVFLNKGSLAHQLDAWHARHPDQRRFWPESFVVPGDEARLAQFRAGAPGTIFAVKPENLYGGQGITLTRDPRPEPGQAAVIQRYIDNPFLLNGHKFHARVYVMVSGFNPIRAYVYREGIARLAPEPYATTDAALARPGIHVTNTALHLKHPDLRIDQDPAREATGNIWSMSAAYRQMAAAGLDAELVWARVADMARRFLIIAAETGLFARQAAEHPRYAFPPRVFGLDVLIDEKGEPWLIEYQRNPALTGNPLVNRINGELCSTIFAMTCYTMINKLDGRPPAALDHPRLRAAIESEREHTVRGLFERVL
jgi:hypothetical protein